MVGMAEKDAEAEFAEARSDMEELRAQCLTVVLGTSGRDGRPLSSYAPVAWRGDGRMLVYVSALAKHYGHLRVGRRASAMLIEDEGVAENLFARRRLAMDCAARLVVRDGEEWEAGMACLEERHGSTVAMLRDLVDFDLFELEPAEGRLVLGFGRAYRVWGEGLRQLGYVGSGSGGGHRARE